MAHGKLGHVVDVTYTPSVREKLFAGNITVHRNFSPELFAPGHSRRDGVMSLKSRILEEIVYRVLTTWVGGFVVDVRGQTSLLRKQ